jgi:hypothetical protein
MSMPVTDEQVATLRAALTDDMDRYRQLFGQLDRDSAKKSFTALVAAAFGLAVERRFGQGDQRADIVTFVGDVRSRSDRLARELDPELSERVIRAVLGDGSVRDLSDDAVMGTQTVLLIGLIADERLDDAGLDVFLVGARKLADQLMS